VVQLKRGPYLGSLSLPGTELEIPLRAAGGLTKKTEPEPYTPRGPCGEERIHDLRNPVLGNPVPVIGDDDLQAVRFRILRNGYSDLFRSGPEAVFRDIQDVKRKISQGFFSRPIMIPRPVIYPGPAGISTFLPPDS
jgi:hypothetical protein